jgi:hypothetical protein
MQTDATNYVPGPFVDGQRTIFGVTNSCNDNISIVVVDANGQTSSADGYIFATYTIPADAVFPLQVTATTPSNGNASAVLSDMQGLSYAIAPNGAWNWDCQIEY